MHKQQYADAQDRGLLGKLCPGEKRLEGKIFYLDNVKKRPTALLLETISLLGGVSWSHGVLLLLALCRCSEPQLLFMD